MSNKQQHTPGPWVVYYRRKVAAIEGTPLQDRPVAQWVYNGADARLIAAAPELLSALKSARERLLLDFGKFQNECFAKKQVAILWPEISLIEAAIAKAEGK